MKKICLILLRTFIFSAVATQLAAFVCDKLSVSLPFGRATLTLLFSFLMTLSIVFEMLKDRSPHFPSRKLSEILETEGYTPEFYRLVQMWQEKCSKKGEYATAALVMSELLIDGGHYTQGFDELAKLDFKSLSCRQKQIYFNTYLYGAVLCGNKSAADEIYDGGRNYLISVTSKSLACSVKHTLGCYEYLNGNLSKAEELFMQAIGGTKANDVLCEAYLALSVCYLDTERLQQAKKSVETAALYADNVPLKNKVSRARTLVEQAFSEEISRRQAETQNPDVLV
jgi:tetratricopeptide (TPR) repeat protein